MIRGILTVLLVHAAAYLTIAFVSQDLYWLWSVGEWDPVERFMLVLLEFLVLSLAVPAALLNVMRYR